MPEELQPPTITDLGRINYADAYALQQHHLARVVENRENTVSPRSCGVILLVEHDPPVITLTPRAAPNLLVSPESLAAAGIEVAETDRGGDITYHGPGQLVVYPILDLNLLKLRLHDYMRLLEATVIDTCAAFGVAAKRDTTATGVWVPQGDELPDAKICAMGVRVRRWVSMHGLALNVTTDLSHFAHIVPCGLVGRPVTSLERELGNRCPSMQQVKDTLTKALVSRLRAQTASTERAPSIAAE